MMLSHIGYVALATALAATAASASLTASLQSVVSLNSGTVHKEDLTTFAQIPCQYLEAENVTCAQCSWGIGNACPYLFSTNTTTPTCTQNAAMPGMDQPGGDYAATPLSGGSDACASQCCTEAACVAWTYVPAAPSNFIGCTQGQPCCYRKSIAPTPVSSTIPGIVSGTVNRDQSGLTPPPLGMRSSVPLGGIGAGALELRADGSIHEVTIMNASPAGGAKIGTLGDMTLAMRVAGSAGNNASVSRLVRTSPLANSAGIGSGIDVVDSITYSGSYPVSRLAIADAGLQSAGVNATLFAYSTLKPGDMVASGVPAVAFSLVASNANAYPVNVSFLLTMPWPAVAGCTRNAGGNVTTTTPASSAAQCMRACVAVGEARCSAWTFRAPSQICSMTSVVSWPVYDTDATCGVVGSWSSDGSYLSYLQNPLGGLGGPSNGDVTLQPVVDGPATVSFTTGDSLSAIINAFAASGAPGSATPFRNTVGAVGAASVTATIPAGSTATISIVFTWYFPDRDHMGQDIGNYYANQFESSIGVAQSLGTTASLQSVIDTINAHHAVFAGPQSTLPEWMQDMAINQMSHFRGLIWTKDGRAREYEAMDCPDVDSQHNDHQRHLPYLWMMPDFETQKMRKWGEAQYSDGHLPEYLGSFSLDILDTPGGRVMGDTTSIWIIELLELYLHTGDFDFLAELYPIAAGGVNWQIGVSSQLGLPYELVCTYDIIGLQQYPSTTFNSFLHLAAMRAGAYLARVMNDSATENAANAAFTRGANAMQQLLWNSTYSYFRAYITGDAVMGDSMYGEMLALEHGLGFTFPSNMSQYAAHLAAEMKYNGNPYGITVLTGRHEPPPMELPPRLKRIGDKMGVNLTLGQDGQDNVNWMGAGPTWSFMSLAIGNENITNALEPTRLSVENWRTRLNDWWNIAGITTSGTPDWPMGGGQPYITSHYGFLLPDYHLIYALTGQMTNIPGGTLSFQPKYACPYTLPLLLAGTTGTISCNGGKYTVSVAFGALNLPAGGLSIAGSAYPGAVSLSAGQSVTW